MNENNFEEKVGQLKEEVGHFEEQITPQTIELTAVRLEKLNYTPPVTIPNASFLRLTRNGLLDEIEKLLALSDKEACALAPDEPMECRDLRIQFISVLIYYYKRLMLLRQDDPEAWDEIDELYVHD